MNMDSGNDAYILQALLDTVSQSECVTRKQLFEQLHSYGFTETRINKLFDEIDLRSQIKIADLSNINQIKKGNKTIAVTYPAYNNRGIPAKNPYNESITTILDSIQEIIYSAREKILILSPYAEDDGLEYLRDALIMKLENGL